MSGSIESPVAVGNQTSLIVIEIISRGLATFILQHMFPSTDGIELLTTISLGTESRLGLLYRIWTVRNIAKAINLSFFSLKNVP